MWAEKVAKTKPRSTPDYKDEDTVRRTLRNVRQLDEELKEHGAQVPKGAAISLFRSWKT